MDDRTELARSKGSTPVDATVAWIELLGAAAHPRRLAVLATLREAGALRRDDLATRVVARSLGIAPDAVTGHDRNRAAADLHHVHLPTLAEEGLVTTTEDDDSVTIHPGPAFEAEVVETLEAAVGGEGADEHFVAALGEPRRHRVVSALVDADSPVEIVELAGAVSQDGEQISGDDRPSESALRLHHVDVPKLEAAGIVEYDTDERIVTYVGLPADLESAIVVA